MKKDDPKAIAEIIASLRESADIGKQFHLAKIWKEWPTLVGMKLMPRGRPLGVRDKTLIVEIESSVWIHQFSYHEHAILRRINELLQEDTLDEMFFVLSEEGLEELPDSADEKEA